MLTLTMTPHLSVPSTHFDFKTLTLDSTLSALFLYDAEIEDTHPVIEVAGLFDNYPILPGIILKHQGKFVGMVSRRRFLERMSRPYARELFLQRPIQSLYGFIQTELAIVPIDTCIVKAAQLSLKRPHELLYEPLVVEMGEEAYCLVDVHQLLVAQSQIHKLTSRLLDQSNYAQQVQTEKMVSLGRMVAGVAHEIRNPINSVSGNIDFLINYFNGLVQLLDCYNQELGEKSEQIKELEEEIDLEFVLEDMPRLLKSMQLGSQRLTQIVNSLRNFARMDDRKKQVMDIHECIDGTLLILDNRLKQGIRVLKDYDQIPLLECYSGQLSQVFMNLLANAIDVLMEKKEKEADKDWEPQIQIVTRLVNSVQGERRVSVKIIDNGLGISEENQTKLFQTFFTTKPLGKGTGFGLPISYQIVTEKHQGELKFKSQEGVGTEFEVILPIPASAPHPDLKGNN
ncbi:HAMP domain-containing histidine kinase [Spirulina subsalsa FACHB-351]|uniref:histidine kinase n=1 Tax=Spirulina subsalsa FACHB-351 TaxID=234711 RepID=A0ABT3L747_9CYAN|nr:HAMP domain-containing histidine kinase [Spirulina subsalsa]MCW6037331.1 HAMP domain-containing histidine kinase [Spirulina subsalsa FACHB-351]